MADGRTRATALVRVFVMSDRSCLQCGEPEAAIKASQSTADPIFCGAEDHFGECEWEAERHRFRDWSDKELANGWMVRPEHFDKYRRITTSYEIADGHRTNEWRKPHV